MQKLCKKYLWESSHSVLSALDNFPLWFRLFNSDVEKPRNSRASCKLPQLRVSSHFRDLNARGIACHTDNLLLFKLAKKGRLTPPSTQNSNLGVSYREFGQPSFPCGSSEGHNACYLEYKHPSLSQRASSQLLRVLSSLLHRQRFSCYSTLFAPVLSFLEPHSLSLLTQKAPEKPELKGASFEACNV